MSDITPFPEPGSLSTQSTPTQPPAVTTSAPTSSQDPLTQATASPYEGESAKYKIKIISDKCIGAASCVAVAVKAFKLNSSQIVELLPTVNEESEDNILLAAQSCPVLAIEIFDKVTGEKVWPK